MTVTTKRDTRRRPPPRQPTADERRILAALDDGPRTAAEIGVALGLAADGVAATLSTLRELQRAFTQDNETWVSIAWWLPRNSGLMYSIARSALRRNPHVELGDLVTVVHLAFCKCVRVYRPGRGAKFLTYAGRAAQYDCGIYGATERRRGVHVASWRLRDPAAGPRVRSLGDIARRLSRPFDPPAPAALGCRPYDDPQFWDKATLGLPEREREVLLAHYRDGRSLTAIAPSLGVSKERVRQIADRALERIRKSGALAEYDPA